MDVIEEDPDYIFWIIDNIKEEKLPKELREVIRIIKKFDTRGGRIPIEDRSYGAHTSDQKPIEEVKVEEVKIDTEKEFDKMIEKNYKGIKMPIGQFKGKLLTELYQSSKTDNVIKSRFKWMIEKFDLSETSQSVNPNLKAFLIDIKNKH